MRFYIASGLENIDRVKTVIGTLTEKGHEITHDWTLHGDVRGEGEETMSSVANAEAFAVISSDCVILMLPGGRGTHTELGLALASRSNKRIILWSETGDEFGGGEKTCGFYHHSAVERLCCSFDELLDYVKEL